MQAAVLLGRATPGTVCTLRTTPVSGLGNLRACCLPSFQSRTSRLWSPSLSSRALRGPLALFSECPSTFSWPTVHLRWPPALADKTGFDRRHSVSSVLFEPFSLSLFSLHAGQRMSVRATLSSSVHGWIYHRLLPPFDEFVLKLATCLELRLCRLAVLDIASIPGNDFQSSTYSRPGGAHNLCVFGLHLFSTGWCTQPVRLRSPLIFAGPGARSPRQYSMRPSNPFLGCLRSFPCSPPTRRRRLPGLAPKPFCYARGRITAIERPIPLDASRTPVLGGRVRLGRQFSPRARTQ